MDRGFSIDDFAKRIGFFCGMQIDFLEEIAKIRAARRLWAKIAKPGRNAKNPRSLWMRFHTQTAGCSLTAQQPEINIVRVTMQALAAVLGGTQSLHTNSLDEAWALPTEEAVTLALRTQQVLAQRAVGFGLRGSLKAYLATCVANRARDRVRSERARQRLADGCTTMPLGSDEADRSLVYRERCERLGRALAELPYEQREVVVLKVKDGMKLKSYSLHRLMRD
jgi:hypothetical protein